MAAEVKILIEGFTNANQVGETGEEITQPTITLIRDGDFIIVTDPGILKSQQDLIDALEKEDLTVEDINIVCITHSHIDHYRNAGMFPNAKILEYYGLWSGQKVQNWSENFSEDIQILRTPGHDYTSITLLVKTGLESGYPGIVAICGDVFWTENYPKEPQDDTYASDFIKLKESRATVLKMADWVIPGHGPIFKVKKNFQESNNQKKASAKKTEVKNGANCKKCHKLMKRTDKCLCRPWLCHHCCECHLDCDLCGCNHKK